MSKSPTKDRVKLLSFLKPEVFRAFLLEFPLPVNYHLLWPTGGEVESQFCPKKILSNPTEAPLQAGPGLYQLQIGL